MNGVHSDDVENRFWAKVDTNGPGGCWLWRASITTGGYGQFRFDGTPGKAHRFAYELLVGPIPDDLTIDHLCRVRNCVNPDHLEPVPHRVNVLRGVANPAINARKTVCPKCGGPFTLNAAGHRRCLPCAKEAVRHRHATDPEFRAREAEYKRTRYATDPEFRARKVEYWRTRYADPEFRERKLANDRSRYATDPEVRARKAERRRRAAVAAPARGSP